MRGKLLSTFRLGLSQWAPDHNAIDYAAIRDKHAQLAQPRCFESWCLGKISLRKLAISFGAFFVMNNMLPFPLSPREVHDLHPAAFWGWMGPAPPNIVWAWGVGEMGIGHDGVGENGLTGWEFSQNPFWGLHWGLADLTGALCSPWTLSQQVIEAPISLKLTRLGFPKLFSVNQVSWSFSRSCGLPDAHSSPREAHVPELLKLWQLLIPSQASLAFICLFRHLFHQPLWLLDPHTPRFPRFRQVHPFSSQHRKISAIICCRMDPTSGPLGPTTLQATTSNLNFSLKIHVSS